MHLSTQPRTFPTGTLLVTQRVSETLNPADVIAALKRHTSADWGELCRDDREENERALREGGRLFSVYRDRNQVRFYIITEADRSATTVLLPEDY